MLIISIYIIQPRLIKDKMENKSWGLAKIDWELGFAGALRRKHILPPILGHCFLIQEYLYKKYYCVYVLKESILILFKPIIMETSYITDHQRAIIKTRSEGNIIQSKLSPKHHAKHSSLGHHMKQITNEASNI